MPKKKSAKESKPKYVIRWQDGYGNHNYRFTANLNAAKALVLSMGIKKSTKIYELGKQVKFTVEVI